VVSQGIRGRAVRHGGGGVDRRVSGLESAITYGLRRVRVVPLHFPLLLCPPTLIEGGDPGCVLVCSCLEAGCQVPGLHPLGPLAVDDATCDLVRLARWFARVPGANLAAVVEIGLEVVELHHAAPPAQIAAWLSARGVSLGPVVVAGRGCLDIVVSSDQGPPAQAQRLELRRSGGSLFVPGVGELVVLPPSRFIDGSHAGWLTPWEQDGMPPGREEVLAALAHLPDPDRLAAWNVAHHDGQDGRAVRACGL
jgi:hypothetical protein